MSKRILISDIAKSLGVSVTTISFILNGKAKEKRISDALTNRVLEYVKKVGYKPNQLAQSLRTGQTKILGLLVEDISNLFFANIAKHIEESSYASGYHLLYCSMGNDTVKARELIQLFYDRQVDGFIITPTEGLEDVVALLLKNNVPVVLFDRYIPQVETNYVVSDNFNGSFRATKHLLENEDNRRIGFVSLYSDQTQMRDRMDGYMKALDQYQRQAYIKKIQIDEQEDIAMAQIFEFIEDNKLDAVLFATNYLAITGLKVNKKYGKLPAMVAFDDHTLFKLHEPAISVVSQRIETIAEELVKVLLRQIRNPQADVKHIVVPCDLKIRDSSTAKIK
ncbi:LacI family DNA-binding transcriptional regulator [Sphingobacterium corticibacter]|uniref:LacI family transcriptional regulator n=1 Tax=Sphingobacterium corticibacter TaxID=2171749 RepID=A0A2T8HF97_9SPHI|nr:LacI family DNA-binding transcriptional regulator [Sphingobacterium corticibacter]PVH24084.1 LacI family transcriptional regulator [Sphingobacterium corticibacter]